VRPTAFPLTPFGREQLHAQAELGGDCGRSLCSGQPHVPRPPLRDRILWAPPDPERHPDPNVHLHPRRPVVTFACVRQPSSNWSADQERHAIEALAGLLDSPLHVGDHSAGGAALSRSGEFHVHPKGSTGASSTSRITTSGGHPVTSTGCKQSRDSRGLSNSDGVRRLQIGGPAPFIEGPRTCYLPAMDTRRFPLVSVLAAATVLTGGLILAGCSASAHSTAAKPSSPTSSAGASASTPATVAASHGSWSNGTQLSSAPLEAVSCASPAFCVAADAIGNVFTYAGGAWSSGTQIDPPNGLDSVSCPSSSFCAAVDRSGNAYTYISGSWSGPQPIVGGGVQTGGTLVSVSCASSSFCMAVGGGGGNGSAGVAAAYTYMSGTWSSGTQLASSNDLGSVSCPTSTFCAAVGVTQKPDPGSGYGPIYTYTNGTWSNGKRLDYIPLAVSCSASTFCELVGASLDTSSGGSSSGSPYGNGYASTFKNGTWSDSVQVGSNNGLVAISCPAFTFCGAIGQKSISATSAAVNSYSLTYEAGTWSSGALIDPLPADLISISCPSLLFCAAVGAAGGDSNPGYAFIYSGGS
jgi:hypothetical protein